jgi:hypothetical protein
MSREGWQELRPPRSARRAPVGLGSVYIEAICRAFPISLGTSCPQGLFCGYNDLQEGFEGLWNTWLRVGRGVGNL